MSDHRQSATDVVLARHEFYRDGYRARNIVIVVLAVAVVVLAVSLAFVAMTKRDRILAQDRAGRLMPVYSLDQPVYTQATVTRWTATAIMETFDLGYNNWRRRLQSSSRFFTEPGGWNSFMEAITKARLIEMLEARQMVMSAVVQGAPVIIDARPVGGRFQWIVEMPVGLTFQAGKNREPQQYCVSATVVQVPTTEKDDGVAIDAIVVNRC